MDMITVFTGICLVILCITTVEVILWAYTVYIHCRWAITHNVPDRRSVSYKSVALFSGLSGIFCFAAWLIYVYIVSVTLGGIISIILAGIIFGFHIILCHCWHLISAYINIPIGFAPYTSRYIITLSNKIFRRGYRVNSLPMVSWEEFYNKAKEHKSLIVNFIDISPDLFWTKDIEGRYTYVNESTARDLLSMDRTKIVNKTSKEIATELENQGISFTFAENCTQTDEYTKERRMPTLFYEYGDAGNEFLALRILKAPIFDKESKMIGTIGMGTNITQHITAYNRIEDLFNEGKNEEAKSAFLAYKQMFESMRDVKDPDSLIKGLR